MLDSITSSAPEPTKKPLFGQVPSAQIKAGALRKITDATSKVFLAICGDYRGQKPVKLSIAELRELTGKGTGTVYRAIAALKSASLISEDDGKFWVLQIPTSGKSEGDTLFPPVGKKFPPAGGIVPPVGIPTISKVLEIEKNKRGTPDGVRRAVIDHFCTSWKTKYGELYPFAKGKDAKLIKSLISHAKQNEAKAKRIIDRYLANDEKFVADKNHPIGLMVSQIQKYIIDKESGAQNGNRNAQGARSRHNGEFEENLTL